MPPPEAVTQHYLAQSRQAEAAALLARRQWRTMGPDLEEWPKIVGRLVAILTAAQLGAARAGAAYVPVALGSLDPAAVAEVRPQGWSGVASDGRPLDSLLYSAVVRTKEAYGRGATPAQALQTGGEWLDTLVRTQVADAGRGAAGVAVTARPQVGYTRMVSPPCCQRCAVLAGKFFKWNAGFQRHPRCDCRHTPTTEAAAPGFTSTIQPGQIKDLTTGQRKAIADGADTNQVINSHRHRARSSDGMTTSEGTTRRGGYGGYTGSRGSKAPARLTPEAIYGLSATREEAITLLRRYGYVL